jgi:hypothetical protein
MAHTSKDDTYASISRDEKEMYLMLNGWPISKHNTDETFWLTPGGDCVDTEYAFFLLKYYENY